MFTLSNDKYQRKTSLSCSLSLSVNGFYDTYLRHRTQSIDISSLQHVSFRITLSYWITSYTPFTLVERKRNGSGTQTIGSVRNCFVNWCWFCFSTLRKFHITFRLASLSVSRSLAFCVNRPAIPCSYPEYTPAVSSDIKLCSPLRTSFLLPRTTKEMPKHVTMGFNRQWCYVWCYVETSWHLWERSQCIDSLLVVLISHHVGRSFPDR